MEGRPGSYIERPYNRWHAEAWLGCRAVELPVAPEMYSTSRDTLLVTDLKAGGGSELYGKAFANSSPEDRFRPNRQVNEKFLRVMEDEFDSIEAGACSLARLAASQSIRLAPDDPMELHIEEVGNDGPWALAMLDLGGVIVPENVGQGYDRFGPTDIHPVRFEEDNLRYAKHFLLNLRDIQASLGRSS